MNDNGDALDFGKMDVKSLYFKILTPTLLGMIATVVVVVTDGIFVGQYCGSNALAAVNITTPLFLLATGFALMFGGGCSIVASIYLSRGSVKAANINITQTVIVSLLLFVIFSILILANLEFTAKTLGSSNTLLQLVVTYIKILTPTLPFFMLMNLGVFLIRLDGSPNYAMMCAVIPALTNIIGDFVLVGMLDWGLKGAVWATSASYILGGLMTLLYFIKYSNQVRLYKLKISVKSLRLTVRNLKEICVLGSPGLLGEFAISLMFYLANITIFKFLGDDGIAAFAVAAYCFPIIYMINNAVAQSAQPIISYNIRQAPNRSILAKSLSVKMSAIIALILTVATMLFSEELTSLFLKPNTPAFEIASKSLPLFALGYVFFALNIVYIGYFQSIEKGRLALILTLIRGYILPIIAFLIAPIYLKDAGVWLAYAFSELVTLVIILIVIRTVGLPTKK